ncbi:MAG: hypothetical protein KDA37_09690, partial [Planctomycetales bacterium]|nr:hypothetical protein [Planctomycetales bacterium]
MPSPRNLTAALGVVALCSRLLPACLGAVVFDSLGFEAPDYSATDLAGQPGGASQPWQHLFFPGGGGSTAVVQSAIAKSGVQAVQIDKAAGDDSRWAVNLSAGQIPSTPDQLIVVEWDMRLKDTAPTAGLGPFLGVEVYDGDGPIGLAGSLGVDSQTLEVLYQQTGTGYFKASTAEVSLGTWHHFRLVMDYTQKAYQAFFDGQEVVQEGFVDSWVDEFTDADLSALAAGGDSGSVNALGTAYFDNFLIKEGSRLPGDYDVDGDVDQDDYTRWVLTYGESVAFAGLGADGNGDGVVDAADYTV